jgi:hypothetical protein
MPSSLSLPARKNGRRLAQDSSGETGEFDPHRLAVYASENFTPEEIRRTIAMLQDHLDKPKAEELESTSQRRERTLAGNPGLAGDSRGGLPRPTAEAVKSFHARYPAARSIRREG